MRSLPRSAVALCLTLVGSAAACVLPTSSAGPGGAGPGDREATAERMKALEDDLARVREQLRETDRQRAEQVQQVQGALQQAEQRALAAEAAAERASDRASRAFELGQVATRPPPLANGRGAGGKTAEPRTEPTRAGQPSSLPGVLAVLVRSVFYAMPRHFVTGRESTVSIQLASGSVVPPQGLPSAGEWGPGARDVEFPSPELDVALVGAGFEIAEAKRAVTLSGTHPYTLSWRVKPVRSPDHELAVEFSARDRGVFLRVPLPRPEVRALWGLPISAAGAYSWSLMVSIATFALALPETIAKVKRLLELLRGSKGRALESPPSAA